MTAEGRQAGVIIITEPYLMQGMIPSTLGWSRIIKQNFAILVNNNTTKHENIVPLQSEDLAGVVLAEFTVIGVYLSPNKVVSSTLEVLSVVATNTQRIVLVGDFNCRYADFAHL